MLMRTLYLQLPGFWNMCLMMMKLCAEATFH